MKIIDNVLIKVYENDIEDGILFIPEGVKTIQSNACRELVDLEEVKLPTTLVEIGQGAFADCEELKSVEINSNIDLINDRAFENCYNLQDFNCKHITNLGNEVFANCEELKNIQIEYDNIGFGVFKNCSSLIDVSLMGQKVEIGQTMFSGCRALLSINTINGITKIGDNAFEDCKSLLNLPINSSVIAEKNAFADSNIIGVDIVDKASNISSDFKLIKIEKSGKDGLVCYFGDENIKQITYFDKDKGIYNFDVDDLKNKIPDFEVVIKDYPFKNIISWVDIIAKVQNIPKNQVRLPQAEALILLTNDKDREEFILNLGKYNKISGKYRHLNINDRIQILKLCKLLGIFENDEKQFIIGANVLSKDLPNFIEKMNGVKLNEYNDDKFLITDWFMKINYPPSFSKKCATFFIDNYKDIIEQSKSSLLANIVNEFDSFSKSTNKLDLSKVEQIFEGQIPQDLPENKKQLAKIMLMQGEFSQDKFEKLGEILEKTEKVYPNIFGKIDLINSQIDKVEYEKATHLVDMLNEQVQFEWLNKNSPYNLLIGEICGCCARLNGAGEDIMMKSALHDSVQTLAIKKNGGEYIGKSTIYLNREKGYAVFNDIELNRNYDKRAKEKDFDEVVDAFLRGANAFVNEYNKNNPTQQLHVVTLGTGKNRVVQRIRERLPKSEEIYKSIKFDGYRIGADSGEEQFVVYKD